METALRTKVVDDALRVVGEGQRLRRLELQRQVLPQRADQQELVRLLCDLQGPGKLKISTFAPKSYCSMAVCSEFRYPESILSRRQWASQGREEASEEWHLRLLDGGWR
jgi:wobble nucleotide-excising tRNase